MLAQMHSLLRYSCMCVCIIVVMANACMCVYECVCACMNTMPRLCCYRMELWPLSCQHSCVAIGPGVHGSSRRLGDNNPPQPPLPSSRWESQCPSSAAPITLRQTPRNRPAMGVTQQPAPRGPEEGKGREIKAENMSRGDFFFFSVICSEERKCVLDK